MDKLKRRYFQLAGQSIYHRICQSGLQVYYIPKKGFTEMTAILSVNMGSLDSHYIANRRTRKLPSGLAHFLEHQLFLGEHQEDLSLLFTQLGAESNAYTSFDKTSYFFSTTEALDSCLELLQSLVCHGHFTEMTVEREKEIIKQEISMYQDDSDFQLYKGILTNLYPDSLLAKDVAGDYQSIDAIRLDDLTLAHQLFYTPQNMAMVLVGDFDYRQVDSAIVAFQEKLTPSDNLVYKRKPLTLHPVKRNKTMSMDVVKSKLGLGFRGRPIRRGSLIKQRLALRLFLTLLFGWTSNRYQKWYDAGYIDDSFDFDVEVSDRYQFVTIVLDTDEPIAMGNRIRKAIKQLSWDSDCIEEDFILLKNDIYGEFIRSLDSIDDTANQFITQLTDKEMYFDLPKHLDKLTLEEVFTIGVNFFTEAETTEFTIFPK